MKYPNFPRDLGQFQSRKDYESAVLRYWGRRRNQQKKAKRKAKIQAIKSSNEKVIGSFGLGNGAEPEPMASQHVKNLDAEIKDLPDDDLIVVNDDINCNNLGPNPERSIKDGTTSRLGRGLGAPSDAVHAQGTNSGVGRGQKNKVATDLLQFAVYVEKFHDEKKVKVSVVDFDLIRAGIIGAFFQESSGVMDLLKDDCEKRILNNLRGDAIFYAKSKFGQDFVLRTINNLNPNQRGVFCPSTAWACIKVIHCIYLPYYPSLFIHIEPKLSKKEDDIFIYI